MKRHHIQSALKTIPIGTQIMFEHNLEVWRQNIGLPLESPTENYVNYLSSPPVSPLYAFSPRQSTASNELRFSPYSRTSSPDLTSNETPLVSLQKILCDTEKGKMILEAYKKVSVLKQEQRYLLINTIAKYFEDHHTQLTLSLSYKLEKEIIELFPGEKIVIYYYIFDYFLNIFL